MADPTGYTPDYSFTDYQTANPTKPLPAPRLDDELANIAEAVDGAVEAIKDIRRSDGRLKNGIVDKDALDPSAIVAVTGGAVAAWSTPVPWSAGLECEVGPPSTVVTYLGETWVTIETHVADASFDSSKFIKVAARGAAGAGSGDMIAANNLNDLANAATARNNLGLGNVNNTSDANKPVSTAQAAAIATAVSNFYDKSTSDGRFGRLATAGVWSALQTFSTMVKIAIAAAATELRLDKASGFASYVSFYKAGVLRWLFGTTSADAVALSRYDASGNFLDTPIVVDPTTGAVTFLDARGPTQTLGDNSTKFATTAFVQQNGSAGALVGIQYFTASGTYTPTPGATRAKVIVTGGGGNGAAGNNGSGNGGGGGGAGATATAFISSLAVTTVTVGAAGGQSAFGTITANGGSAGSSTGAGGSGSSTTSGASASTIGGAGAPATAGTVGTGGQGGASFWGGGGAGALGANNGSAGQARGSGGGGGGVNGASTGNGGSGAPGCVYIEEYK